MMKWFEEEEELEKQRKLSFSSLFLQVSQVTSSSSSICHGVGLLVDPFRSHVSRSLFKGLPWFLLPVGE
jgi:hypothetical protein